MVVSRQVIKSSPFKQVLENLGSLLLILYGFVLPLWVAPVYIAAGLISFFWLLRGDFRHDFEKIRGNWVIWAIFVYVLLHLVGLLWTTDLVSGRHTLARASLFLFIPVFMMMLKREHVDAVLLGFLLAMLWSCILSFLMYFHVDLSFFRIAASVEPTPFMSHIHYSPYLVVAIAVLLYYLLFDPTAGKWIKTLAAIMTVLFTVDLFISNGRAGQVMFFVMVGIVVFQRFRARLVQVILILLIGIPFLFSLFYVSFSPFRERVLQGVADVKLYHTGEYSSGGARAVWAKNGLAVFSEHPFIGTGTGDFTNELQKMHQRNTPDYPFNVDVHNSYVLKLGQFGVLGLIALLSILYAQIRFAMRSNNPMRQYLGLAIPIMYATIMMSDVYIELHSSAMLFIFLSAIIYRETPDVGTKV